MYSSKAKARSGEGQDSGPRPDFCNATLLQESTVLTPPAVHNQVGY